MTLQAKIFTLDTTAIGGETIPLSLLSEAVDEFNDSHSSRLVTLAEYPGRRQMDLDKVAGSATLHMEDESVIATIKLLDTPHGKIASQLVESNVKLYIRPLACVVPSNNQIGRKFQIDRLVMPINAASPIFDSPLLQVQEWVSGKQHWPMYELIDKY